MSYKRVEAMNGCLSEAVKLPFVGLYKIARRFPIPTVLAGVVFLAFNSFRGPAEVKPVVPIVQEYNYTVPGIFLGVTSTPGPEPTRMAQETDPNIIATKEAELRERDGE